MRRAAPVVDALMFAEQIRVLRVVMETGPRKRTVLLGLAHGETIDHMRRQGLLKKRGSKRGTMWAYGGIAHLAPADRERFAQALRKPPVKVSRG